MIPPFTDLSFGSQSWKLLYSTAMLLSTFKFDGNDALIVYGTTGLTYEVALLLDVEPTLSASGPVKITAKYSKSDSAYFLNFKVTQGVTTVKIATGQKTVVLIIADYATATNFWMPTISGTGDFADFIDIGASAPLLISGPYLVRSAALSGNKLALKGDLAATATLTVFGPSTLDSITWNGKAVGALKRTSTGAWEAQLTASIPRVTVPDLMTATWKYADSLPELQANFDESSLIDANHTSTTSTFAPYYGGPWILYADDYGHHAGNLVWRGTFEHNPSLKPPTAVNLSVSGGWNFAASAWLNDYYLGPFDRRQATQNETLPVTTDMLRAGKNYVTVLQE
ncbi:hypothetical protein H0H81_004902 [Sphagnurus paluster]|uniref:Uncharacterized protein n=1 Tax=Sphagnurus paluster TaxID=117069 RepID=A0A9P7FY41_9AGAR|nr:hypothetical protein H0H81_004902 [Sphagnurus paluster]